MTHTQSDSLTEILETLLIYFGYPKDERRDDENLVLSKALSAIEAHIDKLLVEELEKIANYKFGELSTSAWAIHTQSYIADRISALKEKS